MPKLVMLPVLLLNRNSLWKKMLAGPALLFNFGSAVFNSPVKELAYFGIGVAVLMFKGDDLAV